MGNCECGEGGETELNAAIVTPAMSEKEERCAENLSQRFPTASAEEVKQAVQAAHGHGGKAAALLRERHADPRTR